MRIFGIALLATAILFGQDNGDERHQITLIPTADDSATGMLRFAEKYANGTNSVGFRAAVTLASDTTWTLPSVDGAAGECLTTNGSGVLSFFTCAGANWTRAVGTNFTRIYPSTASDQVSIGTDIDLGAFKSTLLVYDTTSGAGQKLTRMILRSAEDQGSNETLYLQAHNGVQLGGIDAGGSFFSHVSGTQPIGIGGSSLMFGNAAQACWTSTPNRYDAGDVCFQRAAENTIKITDGSSQLGSLALLSAYFTGTGAGIHVDEIFGYVKAPKFEVRDPISNVVWDIQSTAPPASSLTIRDNAGAARLRLQASFLGTAVNEATMDMHWLPMVTATYDLGNATKQWRNLNLSGTAEVEDLTVNGTCTGCGGGGFLTRNAAGVLYPTTTTDRLHIGNLAAANFDPHGPLLIWRNPSTTATGEVGGMYINLSSNIGGTPAADNLVGATIRVTNDAKRDFSLWGANILVQQSVALGAGESALNRGIEVEMHNACTNTDFIPVPWQGSGCRSTGIEILNHVGSTHDGTAGLAIFSADNSAGNRWFSGIAMQAVSDRGIWFQGGAGEYANAVVVNGTQAGTVWKNEGGPHTNMFDLTASGFISYFFNINTGSDVIGDFIHGPAGGTPIDFYRAPITIYGDAAGLHVDKSDGYVKAPKIEIRDPLGNTFYDWQANASGVTSGAFLRDNAGADVVRFDRIVLGVSVNRATLDMHWRPKTDLAWNLGDTTHRWGKSHVATMNVDMLSGGSAFDSGGTTIEVKGNFRPSVSNTYEWGDNLFRPAKLWVRDLDVSGTCTGCGGGGGGSKWTDTGTELYPATSTRPICIQCTAVPGSYGLKVQNQILTDGYEFNTDNFSSIGSDGSRPVKTWGYNHDSKNGTYDFRDETAAIRFSIRYKSFLPSLAGYNGFGSSTFSLDPDTGRVSANAFRADGNDGLNVTLGLKKAGAGADCVAQFTEGILTSTTCN